MANPESSSVSAGKSSFLPVFPLELWDIIIEHLRNEETTQTLSRLAQTCPVLYARINPLLYHPVRLNNSESGARLARTIESRPELAPLIREIQHKQDCGFEIHSQRHIKFYNMVVTLPNLEKLCLKNNLAPIGSFRWATDQEREHAYMKWFTADEPRPLKQIRDFGVGPSGESSFSPPSDEKFNFERPGTDKTLFWTSFLQNPVGFPALRVCHIGCDDDLSDPNRRTRQPKFDQAIFHHAGLRKLCITGCIFRSGDVQRFPETPHGSTALEDLTLLNCDMEPIWLATMLEYPKALKRFTFRGPLGEDPPDPEFQTPVEAVENHQASLEFMDYDLYWGHEEDTDLGLFRCLKHLTITLSALAGRECHELDVEDGSILPESLESLTLRYDESKAWALSAIFELVRSENLPNLRRFICEVPETIEMLPSINPDKTNPPCLEICQEGNTWQEKFQELHVELSMVPVPYPLTMPKYDLCTCECLPFYHRMPFHPHDPDLALPWDEDVFFEDPWDDTDMDEDLEEVMSEFDGGDASDFSQFDTDME